MNALRTLLALTSLTALVACVAGPVEEPVLEGEVGEAASELVFAPKKPDLNWAGTASYGAGWAQKAFQGYRPGLYIFNNGQRVYGALQLSPGTICRFPSYDENQSHVFLNSAHCSGKVPGLQVSLACQKHPELQHLACTGTATAGSGHQSSMGLMLQHALVCAPDGCYEGPFPPGPSGPNGPADCPQGQSPCGGNGCCGPGERCGDSGCWVPSEGDPAIAIQELGL